MRAGAGLARNRRAVRLHTPDPVFAFSCERTLVNLALSASVQPTSTLPLMRQPAATVNLDSWRSFGELSLRGGIGLTAAGVGCASSVFSLCSFCVGSFQSAIKNLPMVD